MTCNSPRSRGGWLLCASLPMELVPEHTTFRMVALPTDAAFARLFLAALIGFICVEGE